MFDYLLMLFEPVAFAVLWICAWKVMEMAEGCFFCFGDWRIEDRAPAERTGGEILVRFFWVLEIKLIRWELVVQPLREKLNREPCLIKEGYFVFVEWI